MRVWQFDFTISSFASDTRQIENHVGQKDSYGLEDNKWKSLG